MGWRYYCVTWNIASPKALWGDEHGFVTNCFCHLKIYVVTKYCVTNYFYFPFPFYFISYGVTIVLRHLKIYVGTKYCITDYIYFIYYFFIKLWGDDIIVSLEIVSPEILRYLRLYGVTNMVSSPKHLFVDTIIRHQIFSFRFVFFLLSYLVMKLFRHLMY